jgi:glucose-1-phosphate cytidylyltransferase
MKVVILAGGYGTRISEESRFKPKPMVEIGGKPILWHIMKLYGHYGFNDFLISAGYKQHVIKEYFADYFLHSSDVTFDFTGGKRDVIYHRSDTEPWKVTVVDTGLDTLTGGRVKRLKPYLDGERFFLTYGDGVSNVDIAKLLEFHKSHGKLVTITGVNPGQRYGTLEISGSGKVEAFREKARGDGAFINGGFMVCESAIADYIDGDMQMLEREPMERLARDGELMAYRHDGFWQPMDTVRERECLEAMWASGSAAWKVWE